MNSNLTRRKSCPVCDGTNVRELFRCAYTAPPIRDYLISLRDGLGVIVDFEALHDAEYLLQECLTCGLIYQEYAPDEDLSTLLYNRWIDAGRSRDRSERNVRAKGRMALEIMATLDYLRRDDPRRDPRTLRFVDFGMGWGNWCRLANAFGVDCYGVELSDDRTEHAEAQGVRTLRPGDLEPDSYDFINTEQVFEHLPEPLAAAMSLARTLRRGGILKISVPNGIRAKQALAKGQWTAPHGSRWSLDIVAPLAHLNAFTHRPLALLGSLAGLERVQMPARLRYRYIPTWEPAASLLKRTLGLHYRAIRRQDTVVWFRRNGRDPDTRDRGRVPR